MDILFTCTKCQKEKPKSAFHKRKNRKKGISSHCKECKRKEYNSWLVENQEKRREDHKQWVKNNPIRARKNWSNSDRQRREELRLWFMKLKNKPCQDCKQNFHPFAMDFDHRDTDKKINNVSTMVGRRFSKENILKEIAKCDLVCAVCHRMRTLKRQFPKWETIE